jgi:hypothetical protein
MTPASPTEPDDFAAIEALVSRYRPTATPDGHLREQLARRAVATRWYNQIEAIAAAFLLGVTVLTIAIAGRERSPSVGAPALQPIALPAVELEYVPDTPRLAALPFASRTPLQPVPEIHGRLFPEPFNLSGVTP